jgi:hypothetical protein
MHIEEQRWAPLPASCTPKPYSLEIAAGVHVPEGVGFCVVPMDEPILYNGQFPTALAGGGLTWAFVARSCTEFASYPAGTVPHGKGISHLAYVSGNGWPTPMPPPTVDVEHPKPGRPIDLTHVYPGGGKVGYRWLVVANSGAQARKCWWSANSPNGASAAELTDVINGKAWAAGGFKKDNIKKKLVALSRSEVDGRFQFIVNEWKPGEAWWWGYGASIANITSVINGQAWADFRKDGIEKRLVLLKRHGPDNWTFIMIPRNGLGWGWHPKISLTDLISIAQADNHRVIGISKSVLPDLQQGETGDDRDEPFSAVLVQNT